MLFATHCRVYFIEIFFKIQVLIFNITKNLKKYFPEILKGANQIRTGDRGVADLCLTTWPWRHIY